MTIEKGQAAPDFTLFDTEKKEVTLSAQKSQAVLLLFFPLAFTSVCTAELCNIRDNIALYNKAKATVYGISVDSIFTLGRFRDDQQLNFPLLSDFNREVSAAYGCLYENFVLGMKGVAKRSAFVIDKQGIIQYAEVLENAGDQPDFKTINAVLEKLAQA
ncbi:MAG: redoxin domain-containing protein [Flavihumibacter sp.]